MKKILIFRLYKKAFILAVILATLIFSISSSADAAFPVSRAVNQTDTPSWGLVEQMGSLGNIASQWFVTGEYSGGDLISIGKNNARTAVNKKRDKSASSESNHPFSMGVKGCYLMPLGNFADLYGTGYGAVLNLSVGNFILKGMEIGIEAGYLRFAGNDKEKRIDSIYMIPANLTLGYRLYLGKFSISPRIGFGYSYNNEKYHRMEYDSVADKEVLKSVSKSFFDPVALAGLEMSLNITQGFYINANADYKMLFEKDGRMSFLSFGLGAGITF